MESESYKRIEIISECDTNGFIFDWTELSSLGIIIGAFSANELVGLIVFERHPDKQYLFNEVFNVEVLESYQNKGLGARLLALVMIDSENNNFDGYVQLKSKTTSVQKFYLHLGAVRNGGQRMLFETEASVNVIAKYLPQGGYVHGL
ncbi:hypothetical protein ARA02_09565 (plasmid) [Leuconostoc mesenteroides subsp. jonggajibkimchii]|uniref:GNAT family N-acetyltransferase n=1 Tax=Leuconostoc mesenteroides TaxID=1245 RepID=UPI00090324C9|nr:GNAT family N-acetyltransferase [Leuconostoc mesenteroides]APE77575.1 hypothetical protein ARA02_09565 [Leuconostoc mesenteroides subsp. jonggajibkimchii]MCT3053419.1 N-acetyltransferase [Leuconostoc mesenteroides]